MKYGENKRKHDRINVKLEASFSDGQRMYTDSILNLSRSGACLECLKPIEVGTILTIVIPVTPVVKISSIVRWCSKAGLKYKIGIQFNELQPDQQRALNEFIGTLFWRSAVMGAKH